MLSPLLEKKLFPLRGLQVLFMLFLWLVVVVVDSLSRPLTFLFRILSGCLWNYNQLKGERRKASPTQKPDSSRVALIISLSSGVLASLRQPWVTTEHRAQTAGKVPEVILLAMHLRSAVGPSIIDSPQLSIAPCCWRRSNNQTKAWQNQTPRETNDSSRRSLHQLSCQRKKALKVVLMLFDFPMLCLLPAPRLDPSHRRFHLVRRRNSQRIPEASSSPWCDVFNVGNWFRHEWWKISVWIFDESRAKNSSRRELKVEMLRSAGF
jgi:hypothetical protein